MKKTNIFITTIIAILVFALGFTSVAFAASSKSSGKASTTISEANIPSETSKTKKEAVKLEVVSVKRVKPTSYEQATKLLKSASARQSKAKSIYNNLVEMGYEKVHPAVELAKTEYNNAKANYKYYKAYQDKFKEAALWAKRAKEYPAATQIWKYLKNLGYSDAVCAGIMGNLMAEVGGQTLNIRYTLYSSNGGYYGMCQWSLRYYGQIKGAGLTTQCNFLRDTIKKELNTYGYKYQSGMNYDKFLKLKTPSEAALCFAKAYERCGSGSYSVRQSNAQKAYKYFVG